MLCESVGCDSVGCAVGAGGHVSSSGDCRFRLDNDDSMSFGVSLLFMSSPPLVLLSAAKIDV